MEHDWTVRQQKFLATDLRHPSCHHTDRSQSSHGHLLMFFNATWGSGVYQKQTHHPDGIEIFEVSQTKFQLFWNASEVCWTPRDIVPGVDAGSILNLSLLILRVSHAGSFCFISRVSSQPQMRKTNPVCSACCCHAKVPSRKKTEGRLMSYMSY